MCLAIPMVLVERNDFEGIAEIDGVQRRISVMYVPEAEVGDYVLVHAGFAIQKLQEDVAKETLKLFDQYLELLDGKEAGLQTEEAPQNRKTQKRVTAS